MNCDTQNAVRVPGLSSCCPDGAEIPYISDLLAEAIHHLELKNCYLLGASFGGMVGQVLLAKHPELFVSAVFGSTVSRLTEESPKTIPEKIRGTHQERAG